MTTTLTPAAAVLELALTALVPHPQNRKRFDQAQLEDLAQSLQAKGQLTPCLVRPFAEDDGTYQILAGERRWRAAQLAGIATLQCIVRDLDDQDALEVLAIENNQREDVHPLEEADLFKALLAFKGLDIPAIARKLHRSDAYVRDRLKLLRLEAAGRKLFLDGVITLAHAVELAKLGKADQARAIKSERSAGFHVGGLFVDEHTLFGDHTRETRKPVSIREFRDWIAQHVRLDLAAPTLGEEFPAVAAELQRAQEEELKVVHITREYRVADEAKDPKVRTYGENSWKRADGKQGSKPCDHAAVGVIVAGEGRGESFRVCVARDRCTIHFPKEVRERRARERAKANAEASGAPATPGGATPKAERSYERQERERKARQEVLERERLAVMDAVVAAGLPSAEDLVTRVLADFLSDTGLIGPKTYTELGVKPLPQKYGRDAMESKVAVVAGWTAEERRRVMFRALIRNDLEPFSDSEETDHLFAIARARKVDPKQAIAEARAAGRVPSLCKRCGLPFSGQEGVSGWTNCERCEKAIASEKAAKTAAKPSTPKALAGDARRARKAKKGAAK